MPHYEPNYDSLVRPEEQEACKGTFSKLSSNLSLVMEASLSEFKDELSQVRLFLTEKNTICLINQKQKQNKAISFACACVNYVRENTQEVGFLSQGCNPFSKF